MKIGDRVTYDDEGVALTDHRGTIVTPTAEEVAQGLHDEIDSAAVMVQWDDDVRYWEHPSYLVVIEEAGS